MSTAQPIFPEKKSKTQASVSHKRKSEADPIAPPAIKKRRKSSYAELRDAISIIEEQMETWLCENEYAHEENEHGCGWGWCLKETITDPSHAAYFKLLVDSLAWNVNALGDCQDLVQEGVIKWIQGTPAEHAKLPKEKSPFGYYVTFFPNGQGECEVGSTKFGWFLALQPLTNEQKIHFQRYEKDYHYKESPQYRDEYNNDRIVQGEYENGFVCTMNLKELHACHQELLSTQYGYNLSYHVEMMNDILGENDMVREDKVKNLKKIAPDNFDEAWLPAVHDSHLELASHMAKYHKYI